MAPAIIARKGSSILRKVQTKEIHKACNHTEYFQPIQLGRCKQIEGNHDTETTNNSIIIRVKEGQLLHDSDARPAYWGKEKHS